MEFAYVYLKTLSYDKVFAVDQGLRYVQELCIWPDYIVGDFDTAGEKLLDDYKAVIDRGEGFSIVEKYSPVKDASDTELAFLKALEEGADSITVLGGTGSRMDHVLANIGLLLQAARKGVPAYLVDETNRIRLLVAQVEACCRIRRDAQLGTYLSLLPCFGIARGVSCKGVAYPFENLDLFPGRSLTISNEITEEEAVLSFESGQLLVIESRDRWIPQ